MNEKNVFWRVIVASKYNPSDKGWIPLPKVIHRFKGLWVQIVNCCKNADKWEVGRGDKVMFWHEH